MLLVLGAAAPLWAGGVLRVCPGNPRYFTDASGKAIYLGGHQIFVDLQDNSFNKEFTRNKERILDWNKYVAFAKAHNFDYLRDWVIWSTGSGTMAPVDKAIAYPMPYKRVPGRGKAKDGKDKFDLTQFDEAFFQRLRHRCQSLQKSGIYVSIMLFEVYGFLGGEAVGDPPQTLWDGNVFNKANNINGIDVDYDGNGKGIEFFYTDDERVLQLQKAYVRKVIDTVNDLDNVFYEVANELYAPQWQYNMIRFIKNYEKSKPRQHLVMMSAGGRNRAGVWKQLDPDAVINSPADCFAVSGRWQSRRYGRKNPPPNNTGKPGFVDMDHVRPGSYDTGFVWSAFTRGYNFDLYDKPFERPEMEGPKWRCVRLNVGKTVEYSRKLDLTNAGPRGDLASTGFCLAKPGCQYVVYQPHSGAFTVSGLRPNVSYRYELYSSEQHQIIATGQRKPSGSTESFGPVSQAVVLYLSCLSSE
jgi:Family of unknown function (DUF6298)